MCVTQALNRPRVDPLSHSIEIHKQAQEHLVRGWAVFMYPTEIAQDRDARDVLTVECQDTGCLLVQTTGTFWRRNLTMQMFMLPIVRSRDFGQKSSHHFDDI